MEFCGRRPAHPVSLVTKKPFFSVIIATYRRGEHIRPTILSAVANPTGTPPQLGNYLFTPLQQAQSAQLQSSPFASDVSPLGAGTVTFRFGGFIDNPVPLSLTNGGSGVTPGKIQITDRSGATATVDLTAAR